MFSEGIERDQWHELGYPVRDPDAHFTIVISEKKNR